MARYSEYILSGYGSDISTHFSDASSFCHRLASSSSSSFVSSSSSSSSPSFRRSHPSHSSVNVRNSRRVLTPPRTRGNPLFRMGREGHWLIRKRAETRTTRVRETVLFCFVALSLVCVVYCCCLRRSHILTFLRFERVVRK